MEQLTTQLHLFYKHPLQPSTRHDIHTHLVSTLTSPHYQSLALSSLPTLADADPYLLFHVLTILHHSPTTDPLLDALLLHIPHTTRETLNKAAVVTAYHGLVLWSQNPSHNFLQRVLALVYHNGHTPDAVRKISAGVMLLTASIEMIGSKQKLTSAAKTQLRLEIRRKADSILSGLEIGARLAGPAFSNNVRQAAVRALAVLVTLCPDCVADVLGVLARCVDGRHDEIGAEILSVVIDILGRRVTNVETVVAMVANILESIAMGGVVEDTFAGRLIALVEVLVRRCTNSPVGLERILNGLMGVTALWAGTKPGWMVGALSCWITVLDTFEDCNMRGPLVEKVHTALATLCMEKCMDNPALAELEEEEQLLMQHGWDEIGDVADVPADPVEFSGCLFICAGEGESDGFDLICSRNEYVGKCVETLLSIARHSAVVAPQISSFVINKLADRSNSANLITSAKIAFGLSQRQSSPLMLQRVYELLNAGLWREPQLGSALLRTAAALVDLLENESEETIRNIGGGLLSVSQQALMADGHLHVVYAAAVLSLSLDASFRHILFERPPLPPNLILTSKYPAIVALGVSSTIRWALIPRRGKDGLPEKWDDSEWERRTAAAREMLQPVFAPSGGMAGMTRFAGLVDVVMDISYGAHPKTVTAIWFALSKHIFEVLMATVAELCYRLERTKSQQEGNDTGDVLARVLRALNTVKEVYRDQCEGLEAIIGRVLPYAEVSEMLTEACLGVARGMLTDEQRREDAIALARSVVNSGGGIGELAVRLLQEAADVSFNGVLGLAEGTSSQNIGICRESLQALHKLDDSKRIFRMGVAAFREGLAKECLSIIGLVPGREGLGEEALDVLWRIKQVGDGCVERLVSEIGDVGAGWNSRNEFGMALQAIVHDFSVRNAQVSLL